MTRVLVTAGASGIGLAIARAFHHASQAQVYICDIDIAGLERAGRVARAAHRSLRRR